jgi:hypothetical protein
LFADATKTVLRKAANIAAGTLPGPVRKKAGLSALTGAVALSGLGAGLGAVLSGHGAAHVAAKTAQAGGRYFNNDVPREMYDSVNPAAVPGNTTLATYINGSYAQPGAHAGLWVDTNGSAPAKAQVLDVEPGDATPASAAAWAKTRLDHNPGAHTVIYTMRSQWDATKASLKATLTPQQNSKVKWWIADPTGIKHDIKGADAVQWWWGGVNNPSAIGQAKDINVDVSTVKASFWTR